MINQEKIPKIIHYTWFGKSEKPKEFINNIESLKKLLPDYQIIEWNEDNFDVSSVLYVKNAYQEGKFAFVSDYVRLFAVYHFGGIYLDTDVLLKKDFSIFLKNDFFCSFENSVMVNPAVFGAKKHSPHLKFLLDYYQNLTFYKNKRKKKNLLPITFLFTSYVKKLGFKLNGKTQTIGGFLLLSPSYYFPLDCVSKKLVTTLDTRGVHQYAFTWATKRHLRRDNFVRFLYKLLTRPVFTFFMRIYLKIALWLYMQKNKKRLKKIIPLVNY